MGDHAASDRSPHPPARTGPQHRLRARACAPDAQVLAVVKANAYGHGIERAFDALRSADGFAMLDLDEAQRVRDLGWRGPILLLEGCFESRDLELCSRLKLWHAVHHEQQVDWLAMHKTHEPHRVFLKLQQRHEPAGLHAERVPRRLDAAERAAAGGRDLADDALLGSPTVRAASRQIAVFKATTRDLAGARSLQQQRRDPASQPGPGGAGRLGAARGS